MPSNIQFRRGTAAQANAVTGLDGEIFIDSDNDSIRLHDGVTIGGKVVPGLTLTQSEITAAVDAIKGGVSASGDTLFKLFALIGTNTTNIGTIQTLLASNDISLDTLQEVVSYIKANRDTLNSLSISNISGLQTILDAIILDVGTNTTNIGANTLAIGNLQTKTAVLDNVTGTGNVVFSNNATVVGISETAIAVAASDINCASANYFTKTVTTAITFTVSNVPVTGKAYSFILELTNPGVNVTWFSGVTWNAGISPSLSTTGTDILSFYTINGGVTWRGLVLAYGVQ